MKAFYKIEDGKAQVGSGTKIPEGFVEYVVGEEPAELLEVLKIDEDIQKVQAIKSKAGELINAKYPEYKHLNIMRTGTPEELEAMNTYIDGIRAISNESELTEIKVEDIQWY